MFIDRDGSLFGYVLEYLRDRVVDLEGLDATSLRRLKREFAFFGLELGRSVEHEWAIVTGGQVSSGDIVASVECFDPATSRWEAAAPLAEAREDHACVSLPGDPRPTVVKSRPVFRNLFYPP